MKSECYSLQIFNENHQNPSNRMAQNHENTQCGRQPVLGLARAEAVSDVGVTRSLAPDREVEGS